MIRQAERKTSGQGDAGVARRGSWRSASRVKPPSSMASRAEVGGETPFCDMYGAYERLTPAWKNA